MKKYTLISLILICILVSASLIFVGTYAKWQSEREAIQTVEIPADPWNPSLPYLVFAGINSQYEIVVSQNDFSQIKSFAVVGYTGVIEDIIIPSEITVSFEGEEITAEVQRIYAGEINGFYFQNGGVFVGESSEIDLKNNQIISSVFIPKQISVIGNSVFLGCINLKTLEFESSTSTISIGDYAFSYCSALSDVDFNGRPMNGTMGLAFFNTPYIS